MFKKLFPLPILIIFLFFTNPILFAQDTEPSDEILQPLPLKEIWAYVMIGEEKSMPSQSPITDVGYFVNAVNNFCDFVPVPKRSERFPDFKGRIHLVSSVDSKAQTHLLLDPKLPLRNKIIRQLVAESKDYDGVQIDWELIMKDDDENFLSFLKTLKKKLRGKMLTVCRCKNYSHNSKVLCGYK